MPNPGSSPRVRGKPFDDRVKFTVCRLIPACAGKTSINRYSFHRLRAHPRVCGENGNPATPQASTCGSSPRVRGKLSERLGGAGFRRLIPACAGKTQL